MSYNSFILQIEVIIFAIFWIYNAYYLSSPIFKLFQFLGKLFFWDKPKKTIQKITKTDENTPEIKHHTTITKDTTPKVDKSKNVTTEEQTYIQELVKKIKINIAKQEFDVAKNLIVEWLTIDKFNIDLNNELASIYVIEKNYKKAEIIYKDLLLVHEWNFDILKKLWYILAMSQEFELSIEIYKKALEQEPKDLDILHMIANLLFHIEKYEDCVKYAKKILIQQPRDTEILLLLADSYKYLENKFEALNYYKKVLQIQPYDENTRNMIAELETESVENMEENVEGN